MIQTQLSTDSGKIVDHAQNASQIPPLTHPEAGVLAREELSRFLAVVEALSGDDWHQPTDCTAWTVRDILAHQAGAYAGNASWSEFFRQASARPSPGQMQVDATNDRQLLDRADCNPPELIAELRRVGPKAIRTRQRLPRLVRKLRIVPFGPPTGFKPVGYLTDLIYTRDTWAHRMDICRATGRTFIQTPDHDGRLTALVLRELAENLAGKLRGQSVIFDLAGPAGGRFRIGKTVEPSAIIKMSLIDFNRLASGRLAVDEAFAQSLVTISGDRDFAAHVLAQTSIVY